MQESHTTKSKKINLLEKIIIFSTVFIIVLSVSKSLSIAIAESKKRNQQPYIITIYNHDGSVNRTFENKTYDFSAYEQLLDICPAEVGRSDCHTYKERIIIKSNNFDIKPLKEGVKNE